MEPFTNQKTDNSGTIFCKVAFYTQSLSQLVISGWDGQTYLYYLFQDVLYVSGPMNWQGFEYALGERQECENLVEQSVNLVHWEESMRSQFVSRYKLYIFGGGAVRIVAANIWQIDEPKYKF